MSVLSENRIEQFVNQAQLSLYVHEQDGFYAEVLELVDEMMDLLVEVRRERATLEEIAALWEQAARSAESGSPGGELALRVCSLARGALEQPAHVSSPPLP